MKHEIKIQIDVPIFVPPQFKDDFDAPNAKQARILHELTERTGIDFVSSKRGGFRILGIMAAFARGCYSCPNRVPFLEREAIVLNLEPSDPYWYSVLFHELAHATGHHSRLSRIGIVDMQAYAYDLGVKAIEEIIAESTARLVLRQLGLSNQYTESQNENYILHFAREANIDLSSNHIKTEVDRAYSFIMEHWADFLDTVKNETRLMELMREANRFF